MAAAPGALLSPMVGARENEKSTPRAGIRDQKIEEEGEIREMHSQIIRNSQGTPANSRRKFILGVLRFARSSFRVFGECAVCCALHSKLARAGPQDRQSSSPPGRCGSRARCRHDLAAVAAVAATAADDGLDGEDEEEEKEEFSFERRED